MLSRYLIFDQCIPFHIHFFKGCGSLVLIKSVLNYASWFLSQKKRNISNCDWASQISQAAFHILNLKYYILLDENFRVRIKSKLLVSSIFLIKSFLQLRLCNIWAEKPTEWETVIKRLECVCIIHEHIICFQFACVYTRSPHSNWQIMETCSQLSATITCQVEIWNHRFRYQKIYGRVLLVRERIIDIHSILKNTRFVVKLLTTVRTNIFAGLPVDIIFPLTRGKLRSFFYLTTNSTLNKGPLHKTKKGHSLIISNAIISIMQTNLSSTLFHSLCSREIPYFDLFFGLGLYGWLTTFWSANFIWTKTPLFTISLFHEKDPCFCENTIVFTY